MKKNLRIVSAAAAALLAVAPVAATAANVAPTIVSAARKAAGASTLSYGTTFSDLKSRANTDLAAALTTQSNYTGLPGGYNVVVGSSDGFAPLRVTRNNSTTALNLPNNTRLYSRNNYTVSAGNAATVRVHFTATTGETAATVAAALTADNIKFNGQAVRPVAESDVNIAASGLSTVTLHIPAAAISKTYYVSSEITNPEDSAYWVRYDGKDFVNGGTVAANNEQNNWMFTDSYNGRKPAIQKLTLRHIENAVKKVVYLESADGHRVDFNSNVNFTGLNIYATLARQLRTEGFSVHRGGTGANASDKLTAADIDSATADSYINGSKVLNLSLQFTAKSGAAITVTFASNYTTDETLPVVYGKYNGKWEKARTLGGYVKPILVTENDLGNNTAWNPSDYLRVTPDFNTHAWLNSGVTYTGSVDLTKAGLYHVEVKATNAQGKSVDLTVPVIVDAINGHLMTVVKPASIYSINNGVASLTGSAIKTLPVGSQVHVYGSVVTAKLNGTDTQFYRIVSPKGNYYVEASALKDGVVSTTNAQAVSKTINHISAIYDHNGNQTNDSKLTAYNSVQVLPTTVTIKGSKMYQLVENGKPVDKYVKASNIDGTSKTLKHNSYVYTQYGHKVYKKNGKAVKMPKRGKRGSLRKVASGSTVTVYGGALFNKQYYRIGHNQYIKVANFR